ncbi:hypothetical protein ACHQM5_025122 [Ranunculus cassubicifolius]
MCITKTGVCISKCPKLTTRFSLFPNGPFPSFPYILFPLTKTNDSKIFLVFNSSFFRFTLGRRLLQALYYTNISIPSKTFPNTLQISLHIILNPIQIDKSLINSGVCSLF